MKIVPIPFGLAFGLLYGALFLVFGIAATLFDWGQKLTELMGEAYVGFGPSISGAMIGAAWGFGVGFLFFAIGARIYNSLVDGCCGSSCTPKPTDAANR